jgi:hypothetical protein
MINIIKPKQELICDDLERIIEMQNLAFVPLRQSMTDEAKSAQMQMAKHNHKHETDGIADALIDLGEEVDNEEWEMVLENDLDGIPENIDAKLNLSASIMLGDLEMARDFASFWKDKSEQDTSLFKVRYKYAGNENPQREFCQKVMKANKVYRKEDIDLAGDKVVNKGFGPRGADTYNIWLFKGGVSCRHVWQRVIYLRKGNNKISVNQARKMILELEPELRDKARWVENDPRVAQAAAPENNYWKLDDSLYFKKYNNIFLYNENRDENGRFAEGDGGSSGNNSNSDAKYNPPKDVIKQNKSGLKENEKVEIKIKTDEGENITPTLQVALDIAKGVKIYDNRNREFTKEDVYKYGDLKGATTSLYFEKEGVVYRISNHELPGRRYMEAHNYDSVDTAIEKGIPTNKLFHQNNVEIIVKDGKISKINNNFNY